MIKLHTITSLISETKTGNRKNNFIVYFVSQSHQLISSFTKTFNTILLIFKALRSFLVSDIVFISAPSSMSFFLLLLFLFSQ